MRLMEEQGRIVKGRKGEGGRGGEGRIGKGRRRRKKNRSEGVEEYSMIYKI